MSILDRNVFKFQQQGGKPGIFWEKDQFGFPTVPLLLPNIETVPKDDRKFGYKNKKQRFPPRRFPNDHHKVETDLVSLSPDEPLPPPKPAKNFISRNRAKVAPRPVKDTVTLTQEQLNAILKSVGKVAGGSENAVKISIDKSKDRDEITVESPRRKDNYSDDDDYDDRRGKTRRSKKRSEPKEEESTSIYALLNKPKSKGNSDPIRSDSEESLQLVGGRDSRESRESRDRQEKKSRRRRRERKSRRNEDDEDYEDNKRRNKSKSRYDDDEEQDDVRNKNRRNRSNNRDDSDDDHNRDTRVRRNRDNDDDDRVRRNRSKPRDYDDDQDDYDRNDNRKRRTKSKRREDSDNEFEDNREKDRKSEKSRRDNRRDVREKKEKERDRDKSGDRDLSVNKENVEEVPSPRDKIGLPNDLSWRHMTKAERRRLEMARQRFIDEEEKNKEERLGPLNHAPKEPTPFRKAPPPRSDPNSRINRAERGRDTENSNQTQSDNYRRGRRSRSPEEARSRTPERSPDLPSYHHSPNTSPKVPAPIGIPRRHMTLAEKKKQEWDRERVESVQLQRAGADSDPWGRPGAGAPLRTRSGHVMADYKGRQDNVRNSTIVEESSSPRTHPDPSHPTPGTDRHTRQSPPPQPSALHLTDQTNVPHAMRSSFVFGQGPPEGMTTKERERKQWLEDLEKQIEEKKNKEMKNKEVKEESTWADKFSSNRPVPFPEQPKDTTSGQGDPYSGPRVVQPDHVPGLDTNRVQSAPDGVTNEEDSTFIRGQNVPLDAATKKEFESKRQRYLEHQSAIKAQVEEKERIKRQERENKIKEDMEGEKKLQDERDFLKRQFEQEQQKTKQKDQQRQNQVNQLKAAMDDAQAKAMQDKYQRKMQHLEAGGHDTTKLREHLEGEITSRIELLHTRRERDFQRAADMLKMQQWGETLPIEEETPPDPPEPEQTARITPRTEYGDNASVAPSYVPGLDLSTNRQPQPHPVYTRHTAGQDTHHDPYTEDRVLTPSMNRQLAKPWSDSMSPRRAFGTQTGNTLYSSSATELDGENISHLLDNSQAFERDATDVHIEYRGGKKVRVISAPKDKLQNRARRAAREARESPGRKDPSPSSSSAPYREQPSPHQHHHDVRQRKEKLEKERKKKLETQRRKGPVKSGSRPGWGYKNTDYKRAPKQSERDPFYEKKKRESDQRREKREQKLLAMVQANENIIPKYYVPPPKSRSHSRDRSPFSDFGVETPRGVTVDRRSQSHSPHRHLLQERTDYLPVHTQETESRSVKKRNQSRSPDRNRGESVQQQQQQSKSERESRNRNRSPPVPAIRHRNETNQSNINGNMDAPRRRGGKYKDVDPLDIPVQNGEFVPFTRTIDVLDPLKAEDPLPFSREATCIANARKTYYESQKPEMFGNRQNIYQDKQRMPKNPEDLKNPLMNPSLVLDHPTSRQDQILIQLSTLKESLMQRRRELETFSPTDLERQDTLVM